MSTTRIGETTAGDPHAGTAESLSNRGRSAADDLGRQANIAFDRASEAAHGSLDRLEVAVRRNPLAATAIAAGVGFFLAVVARR